MNKQIEEIKNELVFTNNYGTYNAVAEHLYNKGYRKATDVAREILTKAIAVVGKIVTQHLESDNDLIETEVDIVHALDELRKKYESEGADEG